MSPVYERECKECGFFREAQIEPIKADKSITCPECGEKKLRKVISKTSFIIKGANAKNNYYIPPTNEELGLPSERSLLKEAESEHYVEFLQEGKPLTQEHKEALTATKKQIAQEKYTEDKRISKLKEKHKEFSDKLDKSMVTAKNKPRAERIKSKEKRRKAGDLGAGPRIVKP